MAQILGSYGTWTAITCTTTSLTSDTNLLAGRQSTVIDNTAAGTFATDAIFGGTIQTGSTSLAAGVIEIWIGGLADGTNNTWAAGATDANLSLRTSGEKQGGYLAYVMQQTDATQRTYTFGPIGIVQTCGFMPSKWFLFIVHNTGATGPTTTLKYSNIIPTNA